MKQQIEMSDYENAAKQIHLYRLVSRPNKSDHGNNGDNLSDNDSKLLSSLSKDDYNLISSDESDKNLPEYSRDSQSEEDKEEIENTRLYKAVVKEDIELVKKILSTGVYIDAPNEENKTALYLAVCNKNLPIIECLLEYGASAFSLNKSDDQSVRWETPLHIAVREDRLDIVKLLLTTQVDVNKLMKNYDTVFKLAYRHKNYKLIQSLIGCPSYTENVTLMKRALNTFPTGELLHLLDNGVDINSKNRFKRRNDWAALHIAVKIKDENMVQFLLNNENCNIIDKMSSGFTPLDIATSTNNLIIVKMLAEKNAQHDIYGKDINNHVLSSFHLAIDKNLMEITKFYLDTFNLDVNIKSDIDLSPLEIVAGYDSLEICRLLLDFEAEINYSLKDRYEGVIKGTSVLYRVVHNANVTMLDLIFSKGTQTHDFDKTKSGVMIHLAVFSKNKDIVERLLDRGLDVNCKCNIHDTYEGITPLLYGVSRNLYETVLLLILTGANLNDIAKVNSKRISIIDIAIKERCGGDFVMMLLNEGADINISSITDRRLPEETSKIVERHLLKLKAAKLFVHHKFRSWVSRGMKKKVFYNKCRKEVKKMKEKRINESTICYYDLLIKRVDQVAMFAGNKDIEEGLEFGKLVAKFPLYAEMLLYNFKRGQRRHQLLKEAKKMLRDIFINLPDDCVRKILMYFNNNDLLRCTGKMTNEIVN